MTTHAISTQTMTTRALIETYYNGLAKRAGWDAALADDFVFTGANPGNGSRGKTAYAEVLRQFGRMFETVTVTASIVDGDNACVIATYGVVSPSGKRKTVDIAEIWSSRNGLLASLTIYFDTASWHAFMAS
jgi:ketosteroid isomerase-like protein